MTGLDLLLAFAGVGVTVLVVAGMILLTPSGTVQIPASERPSGGHDPMSTPSEEPARVTTAP